ncbi:MAG: hypothetical protein M1820_002062 [Bogoriella megaspora]|nr:MAG: hypothetical protein M1820_002062 [Bogoriella megaspora]
MDPFTALGFAGNVLQFLDFTCKLVSGTWTIYRSADGSSTKNHTTQSIAQDLTNLSDGLIISAQRRTTNVGQTLRRIALDCQEVAQDLLGVLGKLQLNGKRTLWKSFMLAVQEQWQESQIKYLNTRLDSLQRDLNTYILKLLLDQQSDVRVALDNLNDQNNRLDMGQVKYLQSFKHEVLEAVQRLSKEQSLSTKTIEQHFASLTALKSVRIRDSDNREGTEISYRRPVQQKDVELLSARMTKLATAMSNLSVEGQAVDREQRMLKRLSFPEMNVRYDTVKEAHADTFSWIFEKESREERPLLHFAEWLEHGSDTYWISGKPGSGKSTLLKFLYDHKETNRLLLLWAGSNRLITAKFFFWSGGSRLQKSQEGLLRSLLFEIFRQAPEMIRKVGKVNNKLNQISIENFNIVTYGELVACIVKLRDEIRTTNTRICLFIDGLDEYNVYDGGSYRELARLLDTMSSCDEIKLCLSSRPENDFVDAFGRSSSQYIRLEDLTRSDIGKYVKDCFSDYDRFMEHQSQNSAYEAFVEHIVDEAKGVFLWVSLAVDSILQGLTNADRVEELEQRLARVPKTLEEFFRKMLDSVEDDYKEITPQKLLIALEADSPLALLDWWFSDGENLDFAIQRKAKERVLDDGDAKHILDVLRRRIQARCKGLLEVSTPYGEGYKYSPMEILTGHCSVDFLHRTVRDYLQQPIMHRELLSRIPAGFNARMKLCQIYSALIQASFRFPDNHHLPRTIYAKLLLLYAKRIEIDSKEEPVEMYQLLLDAEGSFAANAWDGECDFLELAMDSNLSRYLSFKLCRNQKLIHGGDRSLLAIALRLLPSQDVVPSSIKAQEILQILELLFHYGADPNDRSDPSGHRSVFVHRQKKATWHWLLQDLRGLKAILHVDKKLQQVYYDVTHLFVVHGVNLREDVYLGRLSYEEEYEDELPRRAAGWRKGWRKKESHDESFERADVILRSVFGPDLTGRLLQEANNRPLNKPSKKMSISPVPRLISRMTRKAQ